MLKTNCFAVAMLAVVLSSFVVDAQIAPAPRTTDYDSFAQQDRDGRLRIFNQITPENRAELVRTQNRRWVDEIRLSPNDGTLAIDVKGNLARMLAAANPREDWQRQFELVAGAGFEPATFGL